MVGDHIKPHPGTIMKKTKQKNVSPDIHLCSYNQSKNQEITLLVTKMQYSNKCNSQIGSKN